MRSYQGLENDVAALQEDLEGAQANIEELLYSIQLIKDHLYTGCPSFAIEEVERILVKYDNKENLDK